MIFQFGQYKIDVNVEKTRAFYESDVPKKTSDSCVCEGCQNYDKAILTAPDAVLSFLRSLGIDPQKPGEVYGYVDHKSGEPTHMYGGWYHVVGVMLEGRLESAVESALTRYRPDPDFDFNVWFGDDVKRMGWIYEGFPTPIVELSISTTLPWLIA